jgi:methionine-rich copper-binding protein CopC
MPRKVLIYCGVSAILLFSALIYAAPAHAQPVLRDASPPPEAVLSTPPAEITLTFDRILSDTYTSIQVINEAGERVDKRDSAIDPANRFVVRVSLPPLFEGRYTVSYTASGLGSSTIVSGSYQFTVDLPSPRLALLTPVNGQAFESGDIPLEMRVDFFDFGLYNNRIRIYVDGVLVTEVRALSYTIEGLSSGVHEIKTVLAQYDDQELADTAITVYVAVAQPDPESEGRELAALAPPDPGLRLTTAQLIAAIALTAILLGAGIWLGHTMESGRNRQ